MGLSFQGMRDVNQLTNQLDSALRNIGYHSSADSNRNGQSWRIVRAVAVAGMAPSQLVKVVRPAAAYLETAEGAKEKDGEARGLKFFVRTDNMEKNDDPKTKEERVFVHPSSANFSTGSYSCPWLVFNSLVRTSKPFLRDVTECNSYALLLFGGPIEVQASKDIVVVDGWCQLGAHARIGSLMGGLRRRLDELLTQKIQDPTFDIAASTEMSTIVRLIMTDGLGS
jgi:ATP-dependent RNA helicase DHX57